MTRFIPAVALASLVGCATSGPSSRSLHEVDGELVHSRPASPIAYEAYLTARLALEAEPPDLERALENLDVALRYDPREPHLWTARAEVQHLGGDHAGAMASLDRALEIRPEYPPARRLLARIGDRETASR